VEAVYAAAGVTRFAAWVHENDWAMRADLERRGYTLAETTRGMGIVLDEIRMPRPEIELGATDCDDRIFGLPPGLLAGANHAAFHLLVARRRPRLSDRAGRRARQERRRRNRG
jgi:hypothetical protein